MPRPKQLQIEQDHHRKAFEFYLALGEKRTYRAVAAQLGVSASTIKLWSRSFGWSRRIGERDAQIARELADRSLQTGVQESERNLKIVRAALLRLAKDIAEGRVKGQLADLPRLIELEKSLLAGSHPVDSAVPLTHGVVVYIPDNGRDPNLRKAFTLDELEEAGHDVRGLRATGDLRH